MKKTTQYGSEILGFTTLVIISGLLSFGIAPLGAQTATYDYRLLDYSPDGGQTTYATQLMGISGNYAVGFYNLGTGSAGLVYNISNAAWTSYQAEGSTLNRTIFSGI